MERKKKAFLFWEKEYSIWQKEKVNKKENDQNWKKKVIKIGGREEKQKHLTMLWKRK